MLWKLYNYYVTDLNTGHEVWVPLDRMNSRGSAEGGTWNGVECELEEDVGSPQFTRVRVGVDAVEPGECTDIVFGLLINKENSWKILQNECKVSFFFLPANEMRNLLFCVWNGSYARILKWNANLARIQLEECKTLLISCCVCNANLAWASQIKANLDLFVFVVFSSCLFLLFSVY